MLYCVLVLLNNTELYKHCMKDMSCDFVSDYYDKKPVTAILLDIIYNCEQCI